VSFRHVRLACCDAEGCTAEQALPQPRVALVPDGWRNVPSSGTAPSRQYCPAHTAVAEHVASIRTYPREDQE
jgi:hypothetical protein